MDSRVIKRLIVALVLIGLVVISMSIIFHNGNIKTNNITLSPVVPPLPAKPAVKENVTEQAKALAITQQILLKQQPSPNKS